MAAIWRALAAVASEPGRWGEEGQIRALVHALLIAIAQSCQPPVVPAPSIIDEARGLTAQARLAVRYVHDNLSEPLSVTEIAAHAHLSARHLSRLFTDHVGVPPATYILTARMDRARALLLQGERPIKEIAATVGYPDVPHFTNAFRRHVGCPPGEYRRTRGAGHVRILKLPALSSNDARAGFGYDGVCRKHCADDPVRSEKDETSMLTPEQIAFYQENGYLLVRSLFSKDEAAAYRAACHALAESLSAQRVHRRNVGQRPRSGRERDEDPALSRRAVL